MVLIQILDSGNKAAKGFPNLKVINLPASLIEIKGGGHAEAVETNLNGPQCVLRNMNAEVRGCFF